MSFSLYWMYSTGVTAAMATQLPSIRTLLTFASMNVMKSSSEEGWQLTTGNSYAPVALVTPCLMFLPKSSSSTSLSSKRAASR